jgi:hypothetical protein
MTKVEARLTMIMTIMMMAVAVVVGMYRDSCCSDQVEH